MSRYATVLFCALFFLPVVTFAAEPKAKLVLNDLGVGGVEFQAFTVSNDAHSFSGTGRYWNEDKSNSGDSGSIERNLTITGGWDPETGKSIANVTGRAQYRANYHDGSKGVAKTDFTVVLTGQITEKTWIKGTAVATFSNSTNEGSVSQVPKSGTVNSGTFHLSLDVTDPKLFFASNALVEKLNATVDSVSGEVQVSRNKGKTWRALGGNEWLSAGDVVSTGFDSEATIKFGYGTLTVAPMTQFTVVEYLGKADFQKAKLFMNVGRVEARLTKPDNMRADFAVTTPTASASIRGSAMSVAYSEEQEMTTIHAIEGNTYYSLASSSEATLSQGNKVTYEKDGSPVVAAYLPDELADLRLSEKEAGGQSNLYLWISVGVIVLGLVVYYTKKKPTSVTS